jgi:hypothetical protein
MPPRENENKFTIGLQKLQSRKDERGVRHPSLFLILSEVMIQTGDSSADIFLPLHSVRDVNGGPLSIMSLNFENEFNF